MRKITAILLACTVIFGASSCKRRPLNNADYNVNVVLNIDKEIVNYRYPGDPEAMRVAFFNHRTGHLVAHAFLPATGGKVSVLPGESYDVIAYNFDTQVTLIKDENDFNKILATTNTISDSFKSKLKSRGTKSVTKEEDEIIVYDPDHLYVGRLENVNLPARTADSPEVTLTIDCKTVVQSWILEVDKIQGAEYVGSISAVITGLSKYNSIASGQKSKDYATVFFEVASLGSDGTLYTKFNTFGQNPESPEKQILSLVITDTGGKTWVFNVDVSEQFPDNPEQIIRVKTDEIVIPEPEKKGGGGIAPDMDEWKDIVSKIVI